MALRYQILNTITLHSESENTQFFTKLRGKHSVWIMFSHICAVSKTFIGKVLHPFLSHPLFYCHYLQMNLIRAVAVNYLLDAGVQWSAAPAVKVSTYLFLVILGSPSAKNFIV